MDMIDETRGWGLSTPLIVADAGYGDAAEFRQGLEDRNLSYIVGVYCAQTAFTIDTQRTAPPGTCSTMSGCTGHSLAGTG